MAKDLEFEIDGYVSAYTRNYVKSSLANAEKKAIICRVCSEGGSFFDGMQIKDQIAEHGNVTVDISGYAASAATLVGLGAKHTKISNSSFYLIHKVMSWVDAWGHLNEDQIAELIANLEKEKDENTKMTLVAAKAYSEKSGKSVAAILDLMKKEVWLTADEALEWGFVDEVYKASAKVNFKEIATKFNMMGMPSLPSNQSEDLDDSVIKKIVTQCYELFQSKKTDIDQEPKINKTPKTTPMNKFGKINSVLSVDTLDSTDKKGVYLNEAQLQQINEALELMDKHKADHDSVVAKMDALHPDIKSAEGTAGKFTALQTKLAKMPGVDTSNATSQDDKPTDGVDWNKMNSLDHMKEDPNEL